MYTWERRGRKRRENLTNSRKKATSFIVVWIALPRSRFLQTFVSSSLSSFALLLQFYLQFINFSLPLLHPFVFSWGRGAAKHWKYEGGGIYRRTWLVRTDPVHFTHDGVFASPEMDLQTAIISAEAEVENLGRSTVQGATVQVSCCLHAFRVYLTHGNGCLWLICCPGC